MRLASKWALSASVAALALVLTPSLALADMTQTGGGDAKGGLWYVSQQGIDTALAEGYRGAGVKVAVIDGQINPDVAELSGANLKFDESSFCDNVGEPGRMPTVSTAPGAVHGTSMLTLLAGNGQGPGGAAGIVGAAPDAELLYYAAGLAVASYDSSATGKFAITLSCQRGDEIDNDKAISEAINQAVDDGSDIISMSLGVGITDDIKSSILKALSNNVIVIIACSNDGLDAAMDLNGVLSVASMDAGGSLKNLSGKDVPLRSPKIDIIAPGVDVLSHDVANNWSDYRLAEGNSDATAITAGIIASVKSKYPAVTNNQILQSVIHNTGDEDHELYVDPDNYWGHGPINLAHLLSVDPSKYPDINPLVIDAVDAWPSYKEITGGASQEPSSTVSSGPTASPSSRASILPITNADSVPSDTSAPWLIIAIVSVVCVGVVVSIVLLRSRKRGAVGLDGGVGLSPDAGLENPWVKGGGGN